MLTHRTPSPLPPRTGGALGAVQVGALARVGEAATMANTPPATPSTMDTVKDGALGKSKPILVALASAAGGAAGYLLGFGWLGAGVGTLLGNVGARFGAKSYCAKNAGPDCLDTYDAAK